MDDLLAHNVTVEGKQPEQQSVWTQLLIASFPILLIIAVFMFFMRQMQGAAGGRGGPMSFGKSKAKLLGRGSNHHDVCRCSRGGRGQRRRAGAG